MAYEELKVVSAISLGGTNKKTGKPNPTFIEGYYRGFKEVPDNKKKSGKEFIYTFETEKGDVDVWGKTDLNRKMSTAKLNLMTKATWTGETLPTPNGDMQLYKVQQDPSNVAAERSASLDTASEPDYGDLTEETDVDADTEAYVSEAPVPRASAPKTPARTPSAEQQAKVRAMLQGKSKTA